MTSATPALANQVMVGLAGHNLELVVSLTQVGATEEAQLAQGFERAVDGGQVDPGAVPADLGVDLFGAGVAIQVGQRFEDDRALSCQAIAALAELVQQGKVMHLHLLLRIFASEL
jgi:hypothetical protein